MLGADGCAGATLGPWSPSAGSTPFAFVRSHLDLEMWSNSDVGTKIGEVSLAPARTKAWSGPASASTSNDLISLKGFKTLASYNRVMSIPKTILVPGTFVHPLCCLALTSARGALRLARHMVATRLPNQHQARPVLASCLGILALVLVGGCQGAAPRVRVRVDRHRLL